MGADHLPRLLRGGKLPEPSYHLGPRSPRWWSAAIDEAFGGAVAPRAPKGAEGLAEAIRMAGKPKPALTIDEAAEALVAKMLARPAR